MEGLSWKAIGGFIWDKLFGSSSRAKEFTAISKEWRGLYEEKKKLVSEYEDQIKKIEKHRVKHPDNGIELDQWKAREYKLMMDLVKAKEEISFWRELAIFSQKENELLLMREEKRKSKK